MIVIFQEKKIKKWRIFFCVCACCVLTKFFLILAPGLEPPLFWLKNNPFVIPMLRLHFFYTSDQKFKKKQTSAAFLKLLCL